MLVWISDLGMKKGFPEITGNPICGAKGIRTPDPLHAMEMRYQLRHSPVELAGFEPATLCLQSRCATSCAIAPSEAIRFMEVARPAMNQRRNHHIA